MPQGQEVNVCSNATFSKSETQFTWLNPRDTVCNITYTGTQNPPPAGMATSYQVPAKTTGPNGGPGRLAVTYNCNGQSCSYPYSADNCPPNPRATGGNATIQMQ